MSEQPTAETLQQLQDERERPFWAFVQDWAKRCMAEGTERLLAATDLLEIGRAQGKLATFRRVFQLLDPGGELTKEMIYEREEIKDDE